MRIGVVCPYDIGKPGGVQQLTGELAMRLRAMGDDVVFVAAGRRWFHGGPGLDEVTVPTGRGVSIRANQSKVPLTLSPTSWRRVRRALAGVDLVHIHEPLVPLIGWMALSTGRPVVATFHADAPDWVSTLYRLLPGIRGLMARTILTAVSATAAASIPEDWGEVQIIPNAVDTASYAVPVGRIERRVAFLGRDEPRKGLAILLEAWADVGGAVPDAELIVMGADRGEGPAGVRFVGRVSGGEKKRLLASSQVFVAPNLGGESFGIVVVEGMAAGCAVVTSDLPAFLEVGGGIPIHVPVGDAAALADAITSLLLDPTRARNLGEEARRRASVFDWSNVAHSYRQLYAGIVS